MGAYRRAGAALIFLVAPALKIPAGTMRARAGEGAAIRRQWSGFAETLAAAIPGDGFELCAEVVLWQKYDGAKVQRVL